MIDTMNDRGMMEGSEVTGRSANMMPFMDAMKSGVSNSFSLSGRSSRSEFWWFVLGSNLAFILCTILAGAIHEIFLILPLLLIPANITLSVRRLHDVGKSGWMFLLMVIPLVNFILIILWFIVDAGQPHANQYGDVPTNTLE